MPTSSTKPRRSLIVQSVLGELERYLEENEPQMKENRDFHAACARYLEENEAQLQENRVFHTAFVD